MAGPLRDSDELDDVRVSVVVPVYNAAATIDRTLEALAEQVLPGRHEVIVVDGGSDDGTLEILEGATDRITLLHNPAREPASSRNLGARRAAAGALAFTDADCEPAPDWLAAGLRALEHADIVQGKVLPREAHGPFDRTLGVVSEYGLYETANLFVRRAAFERAGGFAPLPGLELPDGTHFGEDAWFVWRAKRQGARTSFCDAALVRHAVFRRGLRAHLREQARRWLFPELVAAIPELRTQLLHGRVFLSPTSLRYDLAASGLAVAALGRRRLPLLAGVPYAVEVIRTVRHAPAGLRGPLLLARLAGDTVTCAALIRGSLRSRTVVL